MDVNGLNRSRVESYKKCFRCQGVDTDKIWMGVGEYRIIYVGWCNICSKEYNYSERIDDIPPDKEGRL